MKRGAENLPVQFRMLSCAKAPVKAEGDLGLSGPVVAVYESYWPAKSQVIFSTRCSYSSDPTIATSRSSEDEKVNKCIVEFVATMLGFLCGMCLAFKKGMPSEISNTSNDYHH